ncbi:hypothetical protein GXB78_27610 [Pseudomonas moraviensis subsp. stanleyae]|uniref:major capsid protein n=1 Tax=Pseudomonas moraviensis TaxID=321662 RepID=UPI002E38000F|nr:major capsid protein [Pseudomonas moraviensis]MED7670975.1 hypothetical protein [Pseudomonas moraviensis subsp. stanleyae]
MNLKNLLKTVLAVGGTIGAASSFAVVDTAPVVSGLTDAEAAAVVIGTAVLAIVVSIKTFKYIRQAF